MVNCLQSYPSQRVFDLVHVKRLRRNGDELLDEPWKSKLMRLVYQVISQIPVRVPERSCMIVCIETVLATVEARKAIRAILKYHRVIKVRCECWPCPDPVVVVGIRAINPFKECVVALFKGYDLGSSSRD